MIFPKKEILYAPMLGTLGGGSMRSFGRGTGGGEPAIVSVSGSYLNQSANGVQFWQSDSAPSQTSATTMELQTTAGKDFYIAMVGAGGGGGKTGTYGTGGNGGYGIAQVTVPAGVSTMKIWIGGGGSHQGTTAQGGQYQGGTGGAAGSSHPSSSSGGGFTGLFKSTLFQQSDEILSVGSGGGGGINERGGHGGGFNNNGLDGNINNGNNYTGKGGQQNAGGAAAPVNPGYTTVSPTAGSWVTGGNGASSNYDAGSGGGAGHYGGGGGAAGGGYDGHAGGGGSGWVNSSHATILGGRTKNGDHNANDYTTPPNSALNFTLQDWIRAVASAGSWSPNSMNYGMGGTNSANGKAGFALVWNVP